MHCSWIWMTISHYWGLNFYVKNKVGTLQWLGCGHCTARASMIPTFLLFFFFFFMPLWSLIACPFQAPLYSVQFSQSVVSHSLWPHEPQHTRPPCPSPTPGVYPNSCPLYRWCHPAISSSVIPFSSCPQSFPASGSFQMSHVFITCTLKLVFIKTLPKPLGPYTFVLQSSSMSFNWNESKWKLFKLF